MAGYDDSSLARLAHVNLTTVSQDARGQAEHALAAAVERLDGGRVRPREVVLPPAPGRPGHHRNAAGRGRVPWPAEELSGPDASPGQGTSR